MRPIFKVLITSAVVIMSLAVGSVCLASMTIPMPFEYSIEPVGSMHKGEPIALHLQYTLNPDFLHMAGDTGSFIVTFIDPRDHSDTLSRTIYPVKYDSTYSYSTTFQVMLPDADTNCCLIRMTCGGVGYQDWSYFIASANSVEYLDNFSMPWPLKYQGSFLVNSNIGKDPIRDTLTVEQLQTEYEIYLDLYDKVHYEAAKNILGIIPDSCLFDKRCGLYKLKTTLQNLIYFADEGVKFEYTTPPPWENQNGPEKDSSAPRQPETDSVDTMGDAPPRIFQAKYPIWHFVRHRHTFNAIGQTSHRYYHNVLFSS